MAVLALCAAGTIAAQEPAATAVQAEYDNVTGAVTADEDVEYDGPCVGVIDSDDLEAIENVAENTKFWNGSSNELTLGYTTGSFDLGADGGKLSSRWGASLSMLRNIYVHRGPIGGFLKFGIHLGTQINYMNFEKGHGSIKDIADGAFDDRYDESGNYIEDTPSLGKHYLTAGLAVGPTATFMPFFASHDHKLARLKVRLFFHVIPSYAAFITSSEDETEFHSAFECLFSGGLNVIWRKLNVGVEWKGGRARYKGLFEEMDGVSDLFYDGGKPRYDSKMFTVSIGLAF